MSLLLLFQDTSPVEYISFATIELDDFYITDEVILDTAITEVIELEFIV